jgi:hypothetical protein
MINTDSEPFKVRPFLKKNPATATIVMSDGKTEEKYGMRGLPLNLIIDRQGNLRLRKTGFGPNVQSQLRAVIDVLLSEEQKPTSSGKPNQ